MRVRSSPSIVVQASSLRWPGAGKDACTTTLPISMLFLLASVALIGCGESLHDASARGHIDYLEAQLDAGADPNVMGEKEKTPAHIAVTFNQPEALEVLAEHGADLDLTDVTGMTPLHVAAMLGNAQMIEQLLAYNVTLEAYDMFGDTPVHTAAVFGAGKSIQVLNAHGADLDATNADGNTPHDLALRNRHKKLAVYITRLALRN